ncbi:hypothetical protein ACHAW6_005705, partial [Cyclotella cf. meneghiniana]
MLPQCISCPVLPPDNQIWLEQGKVEEKACYLHNCHPSHCCLFSVCFYWSSTLVQCQDGGQRFQLFLQSLQQQASWELCVTMSTKLRDE